MGRPCVAGASELQIDLDTRTVSVNGTQLAAGDLIAIDGSNGYVTTEDVPLIAPEIGEYFGTVLTWSDELRRLGVRANADTPEDAQRARRFGAQGIGLCRTEHMFMEADRQPKMRAMIMAETPEDRRAALEELLPPQREDFEGLFEAMLDCPVTIRLLDPPLHEFLPNKEELLMDLERARLRRASRHEIDELEGVLGRVRELEETNPMLGTRGCRLAVLHPEIYETQVRAIVGAALAVGARVGRSPEVEIMIPLVNYEAELERIRGQIEDAIRAAGGDPSCFPIGTMIELPRACMIADRIARHADFFSFGTNDLTQTALGFSRDDVEAKFLGTYLDQRIVERSPFETLDGPGVGALVRIGAAGGRSTNPGIQLGICGEHGGDPDSIDFFEEIALDYVSCSPFRVPLARVAAAQAAIRRGTALAATARATVAG
jgi:pyruvate,orthophosphate dikinase